MPKAETFIIFEGPWVPKAETIIIFEGPVGSFLRIDSGLKGLGRGRAHTSGVRATVNPCCGLQAVWKNNHYFFKMGKFVKQENC